MNITLFNFCNGQQQASGYTLELFFNPALKIQLMYPQMVNDYTGDPYLILITAPPPLNDLSLN